MRVRVWVIVFAVFALSLPALPGGLASFSSSLVPAVTSHAPIVIWGNANFTAANGVVSGSGTASDPYILAGWSIDAPTSWGIEIHNTTAPFVIRNAAVTGGGYLYGGVFLQNVTDAVLSNITVVESVGTGVGVSGSARVNISSSALGGDTPVAFSGSRACQVYNNTVSVAPNGYGIVLSSSTSISVVANRISVSGTGYRANWAIAAFSSNDSVVVANRISSNWLYSIYLMQSRSFLVQGNDLGLIGIGITGGITNDQASMDSHTITPDNHVRGLPVLYYKDCVNTRIDGVSAGQVILAGCEGVVVSNLTLGYFAGALSILYTSNWTLTRNSFRGCCIFNLGYHASSPYANFEDRVYLNNFYGSGFEGGGAVIRWDLPYPTGGNYWDGYQGVDRCSGPKQDVCPDADGIGDTPVTDDIFGTDTLPLMHPVDAHNTAPTAIGSASPPSGVPSTAFVFNASASADAQDPSSALQVRWDWNDDGVWDTNWSTNKTFMHSFPAPGTYTVRLEVRDSEGWLSIATVHVTVGPTPLGELLAANWGALVLVASLVVVALLVLWKRRPRRGPPVSDVPPDDELAP